MLERDAILQAYTKELASYCAPFRCGDTDLDEFFATDAFYYDDELWINIGDPSLIMGLVTLVNDSIKAKDIISSARNRIQRSITNAKRGMNYPAVLIGRLGVSLREK